MTISIAKLTVSLRLYQSYTDLIKLSLRTQYLNTPPTTIGERRLGCSSHLVRSRTGRTGAIVAPADNCVRYAHIWRRHASDSERGGEAGSLITSDPMRTTCDDVTLYLAMNVMRS